jgi:hypothetical protein
MDGPNRARQYQRSTTQAGVGALNRFFTRIITGISGTLLLAVSGTSLAQQVSPHRAVLDKYCVSCHNETLKTAGLLLDQANVDDVSQNPQIWERVIMKLTLRAMPPVGMPLRPSEDEYSSLLAYLQSGLDKLADTNPEPGRVTVHRLNRAEYANAIRDLLNMQVDTATMLPPDNIGQGFDNIAEVLAVSPLLMEQYMFAAGRISRLAVGPAEMQPASETYNIPDSFRQDAYMGEDLPFGSRGGVVIQHHFPMDGEYTVSIRMHRSMEGYIRGIRNEHKLDVRLNDKRLGMLSIGGKVLARSGPLFNESQNPQYAGDPEQTGYEFTADDALVLKFPSNAGTHTLGVTFVDESVKPTGILTPRLLLPDIGHYKGGDPAVASVIITGPYQVKGPGDTPSRNKIFTCRPEATATDAEKQVCAHDILAALARQAYRRPVTDEDMTDLMALYNTGASEKGFESGIELALQSILAGPEFLFRVAQDPVGIAAGTVYPISDIELASRISFFLWSTLPDDELLGLAEQGKLREPGVLEAQIGRMMADSRSAAMIDNFGEQWLVLRNVDIAAPHPNIFPEFDNELREAFKQETRLWFESLLREDHSILELLTSDYTYVNERLARHYGIPDIYGSRFRRINLDGMEERKGLLGKGSLLLATSYNNRTSPVLRGKWVLENLLDMPPPPPPDDVPALEVESGDGKALTLKQAMEAHRANPVCSACHKLMDPIGFSLENFDAVGSYRTRYLEADSDVDSSGILFDGTPFTNTAGFRAAFQKHSDRVVHTVAEKMFIYALGRGIEYYDQPIIRDIVKKISADNYTWSSLIIAIAESRPFQYRKAR